MSCQEVRELLPEFFVDALADEEVKRVEEHLLACDACADELAALLDMSEGLRELAEPGALGELSADRASGGAPSEGASSGQAARAAQPFAQAREAARPRALASPWIKLLAAAALLLTLALIGARALSERGQPQVASGRVRGALRLGEALEAETPSVLRLACGSRVELDAGARVVVTGPRRVQVVAGGSWFRVRKSEDPFVVEAAHARVTVLGTVFRVALKEEDMNKVQAGAAGVAVVVAVVTGAVLLETGKESRELSAGDAAVATTSGAVSELKSPEEVERALAPLRQAKEALEANNAALRSESDALRAKLAALEAQLAKVESAAAEPQVAAPRKERPVKDESIGSMRVAYGDYADMDSFKRVKWRAAAQGAQDMFATLEAMVTEKRELTKEEGVLLHRANAKLVDIVLEIQGKVKTHSSGNGEYTHPFVQANLMAEHLALAKLPLSEAQIDQARRFGAEYDAAYQSTQSRYSEGTLLLEKVLDEVALKKVYTDQVQAILTPEQRAVVVRPAFHHVNRMDIYSPIMMLIMQAKHTVISPERSLRSRCEATLTSMGLDNASVVQAAPAIERWVATLEATEIPSAEPELLPLFHLDEALRAGRAQLEAMKAVLLLLPSNQTVRKTLMNTTSFIVPRRLAKAETPKAE